MRTCCRALNSVSVKLVLASESAATLEAESGYVMETSRVAEFRRCILEGAWSEAESALEHLGVAENDGLWVWSIARFERTSSFSFSELQEAKFLISQQKYLEYLESGKTAIALHVLRNELASIHTDPDLLHPLSRFVIFLSLHLPGSDRSSRLVWSCAQMWRILNRKQVGMVLMARQGGGYWSTCKVS